MLRVLAAISSDSTVRQMTTWLSRLELELRVPCQVTLLHVLPVVSVGVDGSQAVAATEQLEEVQTQFQELLAERPSHWEFRAIAGEPGTTICAEAQDFDVVVIGTHRRTQLSELIFGSTGAYVMHHAPCPVMLIR